MTTKRYHHCAEAQEDFSAFLDGELDPDLREALEDHLADCSDCLRQLDGFRRVDLLYGALPPVAAPSGLEASLAEQLSGKRFRLRKAAGRPGLWLGPAFAAVAVALVIVSVTATVLRTNTQRFEVAGAGAENEPPATVADTAAVMSQESEAPELQRQMLARAETPAAGDEADVAVERFDDTISFAPPPAAPAPVESEVAAGAGRGGIAGRIRSSIAPLEPEVAEGAGAAPEEERLVVADAQPKAAASNESPAPMAAAPLVREPIAQAPMANVPPGVGSRQRANVAYRDSSEAAPGLVWGQSGAIPGGSAQQASPLFTVGELGLVQAGYNGEATTPMKRDSDTFRALAEQYAFVAKMIDWNDPVIFKIQETWYRLAPPEPPSD